MLSTIVNSVVGVPPPNCALMFCSLAIFVEALPLKKLILKKIQIRVEKAGRCMLSNLAEAVFPS